MLYLKVKKEIEEMIKNKIFKEGDKLPSEPAFAKQLNVSRSTLREAIKLLQRQGILISRNGDGTYVKKNTGIINDCMNILQSTETMIKNSGYIVSQYNLDIYKRNMTEEWKQKLRCSEKAVIIERIRGHENKYFAYTFNIIPEDIAGDIFEEGITGSLLSLLKKKKNIKISYSLSEICIPDMSEIFDVKAVNKLGEKTLLLKQLHFDKNDEPVFYSYDYMNNNYIRFMMKRETSI